MTSLEERFAMLEAVVNSQRAALDEQQAEIARLDARLSPATQRHRHTAPTTAIDGGELSNGMSRRTWLTGGAVAAGAAVVGATVAPRSVAAADAGNMIIGGDNVSEGGNTRLNGTGTAPYVGQNVLTVSDQNSSSSFPSAIGAYGEGDRVRNGLYAFTGARDDIDTTTGFAVVASNSGGRAHLLLNPSGGSPSVDAYAHRRGSLRSDANGYLWFCTSSGTPGTWRTLAGPRSAGAVHAIDPVRVYDSRFADGPLLADFHREISVADAIDVGTGEVSQFNVITDGATAVFFNVTITETVAAGFVQVAPGSATTITGSTINWSSDGQTVANGSFSTLDDDRNLRVFVGGGGSATHFTIDITGYTL